MRPVSKHYCLNSPKIKGDHNDDVMKTPAIKVVSVLRLCNPPALQLSRKCDLCGPPLTRETCSVFKVIWWVSRSNRYNPPMRFLLLYLQIYVFHLVSPNKSIVFNTQYSSSVLVFTVNVYVSILNKWRDESGFPIDVGGALSAAASTGHSDRKQTACLCR